MDARYYIDGQTKVINCTANKKEEIEIFFNKVCEDYPIEIYGTHLINLRKLENGQWVGTIRRNISCD